MGVSAVLRPGTVTVDPGRTMRCQVYVRNTGQVVDQFVLNIVGGVADWASLRPTSVNLLPSEETLVDLVIAPPLTYEVLAGDHPFAIRIVSREDTEGSIVSEGVVTVTEFVQLNAEIVPYTSRGKRTGRHTLAIDNVGNFPLPVTVKPTDPDALLHFRVRPRTPVTQPGTATMVKVRPRPLRLYWRGATQRVPFRVDIVPKVGKTVGVEAAMNQKPLLPRRFFLLLSLLLMLLLLLVLLVTTLLQKAPTSMAGPSPVNPSSSAGTPTPTPSRTTAPVVPTRVAAPPPVVPGGGGGTGNPALAGVSPDFTIDAFAYPGAPGLAQTFSYAVPTGETLRLLSVAFTDQHADIGSVQVRIDRTPVATFNVADLGHLDHRFTNPPTVAGGHLVTLAVTCANAATPCAVTAAFTATTSD